MVQKRLHEEIDEIGVQHQEPNQRQTMDIWKDLCYVREILLTKGISALEPFLRPHVRHEVERVILRLNLGSPCNNPFTEAETSPRRDLRLHFRNHLASNIFTFDKIRARDGKPLQVVLCDSSSEDAIIKSGPLSSAKVDILVINGDFGSGYHGDWNEMEFQKSVLHARNGKRPLLIGILSITLKDGVGFIVNLKFTDNSAWIRGGKFRLAARIKLKTYVERVREAISEPFRVKDRRGERNKKHYPPHLEDELWRLDGIAKDGSIHVRLTSNNVMTVKDFLQKIETDRSSLHNMIGRISDRDWNRLVEHARTCEMDKKKYAYCGLAILFNSIYQVVFVRFDGQDFCSVDDLGDDQQDLVKYWRQQAYKNLGDLVLVDSQFAMESLKPLSSLLGLPYTGPSTSVQNSDLAAMLQSSQNFDFAVPRDQPFLDSSTSYNFEANLGADSFSNFRKSSADSYKMNLGVDSLHDGQNSLANHLINSTVGNGFISSTSLKYPGTIGNSRPQMQNVFAAQQLDAAIEDDFVVGGSFGHYNGETSGSGYLDRGEPVELSTFITDTNAWGQIGRHSCWKEKKQDY